MSESFANWSNGSSVTYSGGGVQSGSGTGGASVLEIGYDAATDSYTLSVSGAPSTFGPADLVSGTLGASTYEKTAGDTTDTLVLGIGYETDYGSSQIYARNGRWIRRTLNGGDLDYEIQNFVYGIPTPDSQIPQTGRAGYRASLLGVRTTTFEAGLLGINGGGSFIVEFDTGEIAIDMLAFSSRVDGTQTMTDNLVGSLQGNALLSSGAQFDGTFTFTARNGAEVYSGSLSGSFFGPSAEEVGGTLYGTISDDIFVNAAFSGAGIPDISASDTLSNLTGTNHFYGVAVSSEFGRTYSSNAVYPFVTYDADAGTYLFRTIGTVDYNGQGNVQVGPTDRQPGLDDGDYIYYVTGTGAEELQVGTFAATVNGIPLTYTSFARLLGAVDIGGGLQPTLDYVSFGSSTPLHQIPIAGSASYSGEVFGDARDSSSILYPIFGTSSMHVDFGTKALTATLSLEKDDGLGGTAAIGDFDFIGQVNFLFGGFNANHTGPNIGLMSGFFYGDAAQEFAGTFSIYDPPNSATYEGITVGFQD